MGFQKLKSEVCVEMNQLYGFQKKQAADLVFSTPVKHLFDKTYHNSTILVYVFVRTFVRYNQIWTSEQNVLERMFGYNFIGFFGIYY